MSNPRVIKFGEIVETENGDLFFSGFEVYCDGCNMPPELILIEAIENRLKQARFEYLENQLQRGRHEQH